jgi:hypothetical protein
MWGIQKKGCFYWGSAQYSNQLVIGHLIHSIIHFSVRFLIMFLVLETKVPHVFHFDEPYRQGSWGTLRNLWHDIRCPCEQNTAMHFTKSRISSPTLYGRQWTGKGGPCSRNLGPTLCRVFIPRSPPKQARSLNPHSALAKPCSLLFI